MNFLKVKEEYVLSLILICAALITFVILYYHDNLSFTYFGDAVSHIVRARQFIDSQHPGINNIGTVWLPLPHLLLLPFVAFDALFYTGIAGAMIGVPFLVGTGLLLFFIIESLAQSRSIAFTFSLLFALNPNILYIAMTPMNEMPLIFFVTLGGLALLKWIQTGNERWMILCSIAIVSATLCRYEAWILVPFISIIALHKGIELWKQDKKNATFTMIIIAGISWLGIVFWFIWNYAQYDDALKFAHWTYSVGTSAVRATLHDRPQDVFLVIGKALLWIFGPMMLGASIVAIVSIKKLSLRKEQILVMLFFSLPAFFTLWAILIGFVQIDQWWWNWRFFLTFGLFLSIASALSLQGLFRTEPSKIFKPFVVICFFTMPVIQIVVPSVGVAIFNDASKSYDEHSRSAVVFGEELHSRYQDGTVALLTGYGVGQRIMISSRLPLKTFSVKYFSTEPIPVITDRYVIMGKNRTPESEEFSRYWISNREMLLQSYSIVTEDTHFVLLEYKK